MLKPLFILIITALMSACTDSTQTENSVTNNTVQESAKRTSVYAPTSVEMEVKKVSDHVYYVEGVPGIATDNEGFISNAGFIVTGDGVVVFDSLGTPSLANKLVSKIREITDQPIKKVIHSLTSKCNLGSDGHSLSYLECIDGFFGFGH